MWLCWLLGAVLFIGIPPIARLFNLSMGFCVLVWSRDPGESVRPTGPGSSVRCQDPSHGNPRKGSGQVPKIGPRSCGGSVPGGRHLPLLVSEAVGPRLPVRPKRPRHASEDQGPGQIQSASLHYAASVVPFVGMIFQSVGWAWTSSRKKAPSTEGLKENPTQKIDSNFLSFF